MTKEQILELLKEFIESYKPSQYDEMNQNEKDHLYSKYGNRLDMLFDEAERNGKFIICHQLEELVEAIVENKPERTSEIVRGW